VQKGGSASENGIQSVSGTPAGSHGAGRGRDRFSPCAPRRSVFPAEQVAAEALKEIDRLPKVSGGGVQQAQLSQAAQKLFDKAFKEATPLRTNTFRTEHLLLAADAD